ncbi:MAG: GPW/gp25 family protein [Bacteroidota bacterium]
MKDIQLTRRSFDELVSDRSYVDLRKTGRGDVQTVEGRENLAQAIINRLFTRRGELARLGHPYYGSRLHELVGELNNVRLQGLAEIYIREALAQEARIEEVTFVQFAPPARLDGRTTMQITIGVKPKGNVEPFSFILPLNLG